MVVRLLERSSGRFSVLAINLLCREREVMTSMTSKYYETHRLTLLDPLEVTHKKIRPYITNLEVGPL